MSRDAEVWCGARLQYMSAWALPDDADEILADVAASFLGSDGDPARDLATMLRDRGIRVPPDVELVARPASSDDVQAVRDANAGRCRLVCKQVQGGTDCFWVCRKV